MSYDNEELSEQVLDRLKHLKHEDNVDQVVSSDLSVNEFLLLRDAGFEPAGMVVGSSIYHIGFQWQRWSKSQELDMLSQAMYRARELAMGRMEEEAKTLGADGIVGIRLRINRHEWGEHQAEFVAIGTAVVAREDNCDWKRKYGDPFTSDLSGQDFWTLLKAGYQPISLAMGTCVYHVGHQGVKQSFGNLGRNVELANYTQALYDARELAMERMQKEAHAEGAEGIVGVTVKEKNHGGWDKHVIEFFAIGTAVTTRTKLQEVEKPEIVLSLDD
ncbi:heavy metal-binding domain-containing protein [Alicyclobacillus sp. SO9]|uniref:heavy metal-binding domain-containing protein n=1 Tax=Alicyclobacillus sp. SO9 TaxID=2665646 RepID=UPI0018E6F319|nr:heavy metal-binding domain-containing protein [Alicyclobacillus sp. SO9]QQE76866.1 YbjQ family protein [Alicyclobacillus sp. SO9]